MDERETMRVNLKGSETLAASMLMFLSIYLLAYLVLFRQWGPRVREEATSCFMSLFHGTPALLLSIHALLLQQQQHHHHHHHAEENHHPLTSVVIFTPFASQNTGAHNTVLDFSTAYFFMDLLHYVFFFPSNSLFILHHLATLYVFLTCRYTVRHGASGLLLLLALAEVTSPCQNVWSLSRLRRSHLPLATRVYDLLSPPFLAFYSLVRGFLAPLLVFNMFLFFVTQGSASSVPAWAWISWMVVIVVAIFVSVLWVFKHWSLWSRERSPVQNKVK